MILGDEITDRFIRQCESIRGDLLAEPKLARIWHEWIRRTILAGKTHDWDASWTARTLMLHLFHFKPDTDYESIDLHWPFPKEPEEWKGL